ncbi:translation initiation factor IF-5A [Candidatus Bathyarchaeota archaeon]|nr:translation initiation factor IF-5A [Candidatus Bathyarchaeota archaeon]
MSKRTEISSLKVGRNIFIDNEPCKIVAYEKSKPGKHGSAKARIVAIGVFDGVKRSIVSPVSAKIDVPLIEKRNGQVVSLSEDSVQLMDLETYEVFYTKKPSEENIKTKLTEGLEVEYWRIMDRMKIMRVKGST